MSLIDPLSCGFAKAIVHEVLKEKSSLLKDPDEAKKNYIGRVRTEQYNKVLDIFGHEYFTVDNNLFKNKFINIIPLIQDINKRSPDSKKKLFQIFSLNVWLKLPEKKRELHSLFDCKGCLKDNIFRQTLSLLPIKCSRYKTKADKAGLFKDKELRETTENIVSYLDDKFQGEFNTTFTQSFLKLNQPKKSGLKEKKKLVRLVKEDIENQMAETCVQRFNFSLILKIELHISYKLYKKVIRNF